MKEIKELATALTNVKKTPRNIFLEKEFIKVKNNLTALQKKIVYYAFSLITEEDRNKSPSELALKTIKININDFLEMFNLKERGGRIYQDIQNEVKKIGRTPIQIEINSISKNASDQTKQKFKTLIESEIYWFAKVDYVKDVFHKHEIHIQFTHSVWSFLTQFENYVKYNYFISHSLKSKHSIKIYELLQSRKDTNEIITSVENFVYMLDLTNTYKNKYQLRYYVLEKAKKELNEKLDLGFEYFFDDNELLHIKAKQNDEDLIKKIFTNEQISSFNLEEMKLKEFKKLGKENNNSKTIEQERLEKIEMLKRMSAATSSLKEDEYNEDLEEDSENKVFNSSNFVL